MDTASMFDPVFNMVSNFIDRRKEDNDLRYEYWQIMSKSRWANTEMNNLVNGVLDFFEVESSNYSRGTKVDEILPDLIDRWVLMDMSDWAMSTRDIANSLNDDIYRSCELATQDLKFIKRDIEHFKGQEDRNRSRGRSSEPDRGGGRVGRGEERQERGAPFRGQVPRGSSGMASNNEPKRALSGVGAVLGSKQRDHHEVPSREQRPSSQLPNVERSPAVSTNARGWTVNREQSQIDGPDFTLAHPYDQFFNGADCWQPAHKSKWALSPTKRPFADYLTAFNPRKKMRFFVQDQNNNIREELRDMSADMDYMRHELGATTRNRISSQEDPKRISTETQGFIAPGSIPIESIQVIRAGGSSAKLYSEHVNCVSSRDEGEMVAMFEQMRLPVQSTVFNYCVTTPIVIHSPNLDIVLNNISEAANLTDAIARMNDAIDKIDPAVWDYLNDRMTKLVNDVARNVWALPIKIADFTKDYGKLIEWLKEKDRAIANDFSLYTRYIPKLATMRLSDQTRRDWLQGALAMSDEDFEAQDPGVVCFETFNTALVVNFTLGDIGLRLTDVSQKLDSLDYPMLYALINSAIVCIDSTLEESTFYILTSDRQRIEVIVAPANNKVFMLRLLKD
jgi:hypothetical protein